MSAPPHPVFACALLLVVTACNGRGDPAPRATPAHSAGSLSRLVLMPQAVGRGQACAVCLGLDLTTPLAVLAAAVDPCVVRVGGEQASVVPAERDGTVVLDPPMPLIVDMLVGMSVRADGSRPSLHAKTIVTVRDADGQVQPTTAVAQRIGLRAELTPMLDPATLRVGDELPLRLSVDLGDVDGVRLEVERLSPDSDIVRRHEVSTRAHGLAVVHLQASGRYLVTARVQVGGLEGVPEPAVTTLSFMVEDQR